MSTKINEIIDSISKMNILEIVELTKAIEKKFDISVQNMVNNQTTNNPEQEVKAKPVEKTEFSVIMVDYGSSKLNVIKTIRSILDLGLKEAKEFVEKLPATIKENIQKTEADDIKNKLESSGAKIELK